MLLDRGAAVEINPADLLPFPKEIELCLPPDVALLPEDEAAYFLCLLNDAVKVPADDQPNVYAKKDDRKFTPPNASPGEIVYLEMKPYLAGPARICRVQYSKTRKTIYYKGLTLQSLKGGGYKANFFNVDTDMWYWVSKCKKNGNDTLYPGIIEIDDDVRDEYWTEIRHQPENRHVTLIRSLGKYSKRRPS